MAPSYVPRSVQPQPSINKEKPQPALMQVSSSEHGGTRAIWEGDATYAPVYATTKAYAPTYAPRTAPPPREIDLRSSPLLPEVRDFASGLLEQDFFFDVTAINPNTGVGGTIQARNSLNTPALQGQGIALSFFTLQPGGENLPHYHPRATELLFVIEGTILVGFTDTAARNFQNVVQAGQATVFPRAMLHFQRNIGQTTAKYISMLNSENPGVMSFPRVLYPLEDIGLSNAFRESVDEIRNDRDRVLPENLRRGNTPGSEYNAYDGAAGGNADAPTPKFYEKSAPGYGTKLVYTPPAEQSYAGSGRRRSLTESEYFAEFLKDAHEGLPPGGITVFMPSSMPSDVA
eukprot:gb/GEZN01005793.1/.p1 GENE.gb/GEZN01005793.1/~~gb/GEZN01005793.1/.p1  ORF type:complete len:380 (-),score=34.59 gb/GEZN01005793.1/:611-1645(-)